MPETALNTGAVQEAKVPKQDLFSTFRTTKLSEDIFKAWAKDELKDKIKLIVAHNDDLTIVALGAIGPLHRAHLQAAANELGVESLKEVKDTAGVPDGFCVKGSVCKLENGQIVHVGSSLDFGKLEGQLLELVQAFIDFRISSYKDLP